MESTPGKAEHLAVLIHGLWGNPSHLANVAEALRNAYSEDQLHVLVAKNNANSFTYDGIELGGERTAHEIEAKIQELEESGRKITKLSIIGYSLGGLVARYTIGLLYSNGWFDRIQPVNFTTFATPHLGVRTPSNGPHTYVWNILGSKTLSTSGQQLFLTDTFRDTNRPLLSVLADPTSIFIRGLAMFKNRSLYANIVNDRSVPYYTACIVKTDPYVDMSAIELHPIANTDDIILDPISPVSPKTVPETSLIQRVTASGSNTIKSLPFFLLLSVLVPVGSVFFLINSGVQTFRSAQRVRLHEAGQAGIGIERYRKMPPLLEEARTVAERAYRQIGPGQAKEEFLPEPLADDASSAEEAKSSSLASSTTTAQDGRHRSGQFRGIEKFPTLALSEEQFDMIDNLDDVGFAKYPVHISHVRHTHAAIVVRSKRKGFEQGNTVLKHWTDNFEV